MPDYLGKTKYREEKELKYLRDILGFVTVIILLLISTLAH